MSTLTRHFEPIEIESPRWPTLPIPPFATTSERFIRAAGHASRLLPAVVHDALVDFRDYTHRSGAMLLRGLPVGMPPSTPRHR